MKKRYRYLLAFVVLAILAAVLVWKYTFRKAEISVAGKKTDVQLEASKLLTAYETDENAANSLYLNKIVGVSGLVESVTEESTGVSVYLKESGAVSGVICSFDKSVLDPGKLKKGQIAHIKGICTGYLMDVVLNRCSLESGEKN